jgi:hypothetical protein
MLDPHDNAESQFLVVADARDQDAMARRLNSMAGPPAATSSNAPAPTEALTPEKVAAEAAAAQPPAPTMLEKIADTVRGIQGKISAAIDKVPGARPVFEADATIGTYMKGLMAGTTEPMTAEQMVEKMAADRVKGKIHDGLTALDMVLQQPGGQAWAAAAHTAAEFVTPINVLLGGLPRALAGAKGGKAAAKPAETGVSTEPIKPVYTADQLTSQKADALARQTAPATDVERTTKTETVELNEYQTAAQQAKFELQTYDSERGGYRVFTEADKGGAPDVTGFKSTAPEWYKDLTGPLPKGAEAIRLTRKDVDAALNKFAEGTAPSTPKEQLVWDRISGDVQPETLTRPYTSSVQKDMGPLNEQFSSAFTKGITGEGSVSQDIITQGRDLELKSLREQMAAAPDDAAKTVLQSEISKLERQGANEQRATLQQQLEATNDPAQKSALQAQLADIEKRYPAVTVTPISAKSPADPQAVPMGTKQVKIDFNALTTPEAIEQAKQTLWETKKAQFGTKTMGELERGTKPIPIEDAKLMAAWSRTTPDDLLAELRGQQVKMEEIYKNALFLEASEREAETAAAAFKAGTLSQDGFLDAVTRYQAIGKATAGKGTDAAQTLRIMREDAIQHPLKRYRAAMRDLEKAGVAVGKDGEMEALADIMLNVDKNVVAEVLSKPHWTDFLQEYVYFSYLSNPATHAVNLTGSVFLTPLQAIMERQIAGLLPGEGVRATEALAMGRAWVSTMQNAWRAVADSYRTDGKAGVMELLDRVTQGQQSKLDRGIMPAFARQNVPESLRAGWLGSVAQGVGMLLRVPTKALQTEDALMRGINYNMEIAAQAVRETAAKSLTDAATINSSIADLTMRPSVKAQLSAQQFGAVQTFTDELSRGGQGLQSFLQEHPLLKISVAPFVKTPVNIAHYYWERTPILNLAAKSLRDDLTAGGTRAQLAQAKIVMGAGLAGIGATLASGGYITGKGPSDPDTRKLWLQTHQPYAVKIGDQWVGYNRLDPIAMSLGEAADAVMLMQEATDQSAWESVPSVLIVANARIITSKTYVQGIAKYIDAIEEAARNPDQTGQIIAKREKEHASVLIPGIVSGINKAFFETQQREVNTALESVESRIPSVSATLKPKLDFFGDPILTEGWPVDLVSPVFLKRAKTDPVAEEMVKQKASPSMPPHVIDGIRLTSDEYHDLVHIFGKEATIKGLTLHDGMKALFDDQMGPTYTARTDSATGGTGKKTLIEDLSTLYRQQAFKLFMDSHQDFTKRYLEKLGTTRENLTGERPSSSRLGPVPKRGMPHP